MHDVVFTSGFTIVNFSIKVSKLWKNHKKLINSDG